MSDSKSVYRPDNDKRYRDKCKHVMVIFRPVDADLYEWLVKESKGMGMSAFIRNRLRLLMHI